MSSQNYGGTRANRFLRHPSRRPEKPAQDEPAVKLDEPEVKPKKPK